jgi:hypothetical protein
MKPEIKNKWVAALRSGEYQQGLHNLKSNNQYCCLGVLCDLYIKENNLDWVFTSFYDFSIPPLVVQEWAGLDTGNPRVLTKSHRHSDQNLVALNDTLRYSFPQIADIIEEQL